MTSLKFLTALVLLTGYLTMALPAHAEEVIAGSVYDQDKENDVVLKARKRTYIGGRDEAELAVQSQLPAPIRKITPQVESATDNGADE
ncbi:MAG: hypothetical protein H7326_02005 [Bdellovibrionaceae bacterium]|nr:hypothetical protein [Pseudobdellovibrionaceae bacterium]